MNPVKLFKLYGLYQKLTALNAQGGPMSNLKIISYLHLFLNALQLIGLPALAYSWIQSHPQSYFGSIVVSIILHAVFPSIFAAPSDADKAATGLKAFGVLICALLLGGMMASAQSTVQVPAQASTQAPAVATPLQNLYAAGGSFNQGASVPIAGTALYAHLINDGTGTYAFTVIDAVPASVKPFTVTTNVGVGVAQKLFTFSNGYSVWTPTSLGVSWTGVNTGYQWNTGAALIIPLKNNWYIIPTARVLKSSVSGGSGYQPIIGVEVGWGK